tara:strand:- start:1312 stop:1431 length:120 start_codon:yes stop_codon:yes gene_type:complete
MALKCANNLLGYNDTLGIVYSKKEYNLALTAIATHCNVV